MNENLLLRGCRKIKIIVHKAGFLMLRQCQRNAFDQYRIDQINGTVKLSGFFIQLEYDTH